MAFEIFKSKAGKFRFRLKAANSQIILTSESYNDKGGAQNGVKSVQTNGPSASNYESKTAKDGRTYFVLKAKNGQVIGTSQMYKSRSGHSNGIKSVMVNSNSDVKDLTVE